LDEWEEMGDEEKMAFDANTRSVNKSLDKIRKVSFAVIHSTTILLPAWRKLCTDKKFKERIIPRDVRTRWNSTYDMLAFAEEYRPVIDAITSDR
ncbi:hypothetical protein B0H14DRAFT_2159890, partial [Mycena olivaceomarginata]